ncbi:MAG: hypothetical protein LBW85_08635, partial [Deltaproteobacteria bacterium]|nr:hypothetical protein [Deltaproteobacteria bacterium]
MANDPSGIAAPALDDWDSLPVAPDSSWDVIPPPAPAVPAAPGAAASSPASAAPSLASGPFSAASGPPEDGGEEDEFLSAASPEVPAGGLDPIEISGVEIADPYGSPAQAARDVQAGGPAAGGAAAGEDDSDGGADDLELDEQAIHSTLMRPSGPAVPLSSAPDDSL